MFYTTNDIQYIMKERKREVTNMKTVRIPKEGLDHLGIRVGDVIRFTIDDGKIIVSKYGAGAEVSA